MIWSHTVVFPDAVPPATPVRRADSCQESAERQQDRVLGHQLDDLIAQLTSFLSDTCYKNEPPANSVQNLGCAHHLPIPGLTVVFPNGVHPPTLPDNQGWRSEGDGQGFFDPGTWETP